MSSTIDRRTLLKGAGATMAGMSVLRVAAPASALAASPDDPVLAWLDQPAPNPVPQIVGRTLTWEELDSFHTPNDEFFIVKHYDEPALDAGSYRLRVDGLVERPTTLSLWDLQRRRPVEVDMTIECSGNTGLPFFIGGIGTARWGGTPLAPLLREVGVSDDATEIVFWGADAGEVEVAGGWSSGPGSTVRFVEQFARSMSVEEAMDRDNLLCWAMNGQPLPQAHGFPLRLIAPGWYGVANVKWLTRIEARAGRFAGRFMAREYVTIREELVDGQPVFTFTTVGKTRLKSAPARVTGRDGRYTVTGVAWGARIRNVDVRVDDGPWMPAVLSRADPVEQRAQRDGVAWTFWTFDWPNPTPGEHRITSRAVDDEGNVQPDASDAELAAKRTFWESNGQITRRVLIP